LVAANLGVATDTVVGPLSIVVAVVATYVIANVIAVLPARVAARTQPAVALRSE
jgi:ABC-type antimicrobial peptide transport system permease subunit